MEAKAFNYNDNDPWYRYGDMTIEIVTGHHAGARHAMAGQQLALVGRRNDCDLLLSDSSVAPHHCLISRAGDQLIIRPVGGIVLMGTTRIQVGETRLWPPDQPLILGGVTLVASRQALAKVNETNLRLVEHPSDAPDAELELQSVPEPHSIPEPRSTPEPQSMPEPSKLGETSTSTRRYSRSAAMLGVCLLAMLMGSLHWFPEARQFLQGAMTVDPLAILLPSAELEDEPGPPEAQKVALNTPLSQQQETEPSAAELKAQGEVLAAQVKEILRLSGVVAQTRFLGQGQVEVKAYFASDEAMGRVIQSRAMRDVRGLEKVVAINLAKPASASPTDDQTTWLTVATVVAGADPYLVASDGSRYYQGARFPNGFRLIGIEGQELILDNGTVKQRVKGVGTRIN